MDVRPRACERAAEYHSLELDGELSLFERAMLKRHLQRCESCAFDARQISGLVELLRAAPAEQIRVSIVVARPRRRVVGIVQSVAATAAVAAVGVWLGIGSSGTTRAPHRVDTFSSQRLAGAVADDRFDWPAGLPRTIHVTRLFPGNLQGAANS
jgi:anti-sigma factor RsiW